jgi:hypothetical protein
MTNTTYVSKFSKEEQLKDFIVYEGLKEKNRFLCANDLKKTEEQQTKLLTGEVVYKIIGYTDTILEAQHIISQKNIEEGVCPELDYIEELLIWKYCCE